MYNARELKWSTLRTLMVNSIIFEEREGRSNKRISEKEKKEQTPSSSANPRRKGAPLAQQYSPLGYRHNITRSMIRMF